MIQEATELIGKKPEVYSLARLPPDLSFEETFQNMKTLLDEGLFGAYGASEMKRASLERAQKVSFRSFIVFSSIIISSALVSLIIPIIHSPPSISPLPFAEVADTQIIPIAYVETEVSLWSYEPEIQEVISWSKENKIPILAYSPVGRGFMTRKWKTPEDVPKGSFQSMSPRFQGEAFYDNLKIVDELDRLAKEKGLETSQLALAWVVGLSPYVSQLVQSGAVGSTISLLCQ